MVAIAGPGEVLVSSTVRELVMGWGSDLSNMAHTALRAYQVNGDSFAQWKVDVPLTGPVAGVLPARGNTLSGNHQELLKVTNMYGSHCNTRIRSKLTCMVGTFSEVTSFLRRGWSG